MKTYDIIFNDCENSNSLGTKMTKREAMMYIRANNGKDCGYFSDYKGGSVSVVCNETGETVYETNVKN